MTVSKSLHSLTTKSKYSRCSTTDLQMKCGSLEKPLSKVHETNPLQKGLYSKLRVVQYTQSHVETNHESNFYNITRWVIQTNKLVRSFGIVALSLPFFRILLVLSANVVPCEQDFINLGNWKLTALTVVAPKTKLPDHLPTILSNRTSNSSSSHRGWLVKTMLSSGHWRVL